MPKPGSRNIAQFLILPALGNFAKKIPIIKSIPGFNTIPAGISPSNYRFYKLSNLVLTLGMLVHFSWIFLFYFWQANAMVLLNIFSFLLYIATIIINRRGFHFTSSVIMVLEIIFHQVVAVRYFGWSAGFQNYVIVIGLFPALMPKGKWFVKSFLLVTCVVSYLLFDYFFSGNEPLFILSSIQLVFLRITNVIFSFISLAVSGGYFNLAMHQTEDLLQKKTQELLIEKDKSEELLLNILPVEIALELKNNKIAQPKKFNMVTVLFADFKNFTEATEKYSPEELVEEIHFCYSEFDRIVTRYGIEKIKTIGDAYMCAAGLPVEAPNHAINMVNAAIEMRDFMKTERQNKNIVGKDFFEVRIGIHSGAVVAGIVGIKKFAYDIWGDTVNTASRMESNSYPGKINVSGVTYELIKENFDFEYRGKISVKGKGEVEMYFVEKSSDLREH